MLWLILGLVWAVLAVLLVAGSMVLQGYFYTEPAEGIFWRGPAAATVLTAFLGFWTYLSVSSPPGNYDTFFRFSPREENEYTRFKSVKQGKTSTFVQRRNPQGRTEYRDSVSNQRWSRSDAILVDEDGTEVHFEADKDEKGNFKTETAKAPFGMRWLLGASTGAEQPLYYRDPRGRYMTEDAIGRVSVTHWRLIFANVALNGLHLVLWFICLWLIMHFQWTHAVGLSFCCWLAVTIPLLPLLFDQAAALHGRQAVASGSTALRSPQLLRAGTSLPVEGLVTAGVSI